MPIRRHGSGRLPALILVLILILASASTAAANGSNAPAYVHYNRTTLRLHFVYGDASQPETQRIGYTLQRRSDRVPRRRDPWLGFDKVQHFSFSLLMTVGAQYALVNKMSMRERPALPLSALMSFSVGLTKEVYDFYYGPSRYFSHRDMVANTVGIIVAAGFILL